MDRSSVTAHYAHARLVLLIVATGFFLVGYDVGALVVAIPSIGREFSVNTSALSNIVLAYVLLSAVTLVPFGRLADLYGRKRFFVAGAVIIIVASVFLPIAPSLLILIALRAFLGIGAALVLSTGTALITSVFPKGATGTSIGVSASAYSLGALSGPLMGGFLSNVIGWRSIFFVNIPLGIAIALFALWRMTEDWADARGEHFDVVGSVLYGATLVAIVLGIGPFGTRAGAPLVWLLGAAGLVAFFAWEARQSQPIIDVSLFKRNRAFTAAVLAILFCQGAVYGVNFLVSIYLQTVQGLNPLAAGIILVAIPATTIIFSPLTGRLSDRIEARTLASAGLGGIVVALLFFSTLTTTTAVGFTATYLVILAGGIALFIAPNTNAAMYAINRRFYGVGSATLVTMRLIGQTLSVTLIGVVSLSYVAEVEISPVSYPQLLTSMHSTFLLFAALGLVGVACSLLRGKKRDSQ
jgi:EmrB/QacA subfamily drug resistance transporter